MFLGILGFWSIFWKKFSDFFTNPMGAHPDARDMLRYPPFAPDPCNGRSLNAVSKLFSIKASKALE